MENLFEPLKQLSDRRLNKTVYAIAMQPEIYEQIRGQVKDGHYIPNQEAGFTPMITGVPVYRWNRMKEPIKIYYSYEEIMKDYPDNH